MVVSHKLTLTQSNLDNGHIYLTDCMEIFPADTLGGTNESQAAPRKVCLYLGSNKVATDIVRDKRIFRSRGFRSFLEIHRLKAGDHVHLEQLDPYTYRVYAGLRLECLSIQQPWADLILDGEKRVENRNTPWLQAKSRLSRGERVLLAIHVSNGMDRRFTQKREKLVPDWEPSRAKRKGGFVHGVVEVLEICRFNELPTDLKECKYVDRGYDYHWVLDNPRSLVSQISWRGNASIFYVDIPRHLLPEK
jgi:hypothetical protein